ncbi:MAG: chemotaxis protein CheD, partial [Desulfobacterales bacterium]
MNITVGISDMKVSNNVKETLITYSLGSCIGVLIW